MNDNKPFDIDKQEGHIVKCFYCGHPAKGKTSRRAFKKLADHVAEKHPEVASHIRWRGYTSALKKFMPANDNVR